MAEEADWDAMQRVIAGVLEREKNMPEDEAEWLAHRILTKLAATKITLIAGWRPSTE